MAIRLAETVPVAYVFYWKLEAVQQGHACHMGITGYYWRVAVRPEARGAEVAWDRGLRLNWCRVERILELRCSPCRWVQG